MRLVQYRVEDGGEVAGGRVDDLQYLGGRRMIRQGFARLVYEPRVFHCDDRLRCEILDERNLLFGEWPHLLARGDNLPEKSVVLAESHKQDRPDPFQCYPTGTSDRLVD